MVAFLNAAEIKTQQNELIAEIEAILDTAKAENRELQDDESARIDEIQGENGDGGILAELNKDLKRKQAIENRIADRFQNKLVAGDVAPPSDKPTNLDPFQNLRVPAKARVHGKTKGFENTDQGEKEAYVSGRWFASRLLNHEASTKWLEDNGFSNALSAGDDTSAGVLVPVEMSRTIIRLVEEYGVVRSQMSIEPMGSQRKVVPVRVSGMTAYPVAETTGQNEGSNTGTQSDPQYKNIELVARKWKAWCKLSDELNENAFVSMGDQIATESALALSYAEDNAGFNGDSTSTYHGITGVLAAVKAGSIYTAASGNTAFGTLDLADFETMVGKLPDYPGLTPVWNISKEGYYASMHRLLMAAGGNTSSNLEAGGRPMFLGYPVRFTNVLNSTLTAQASTKLATLGDFNMGAKFGDRRMVRLSVTDQRYWDEDQIGIKATEEFDINVHSTGTASAAGAILVLQTPAS